MRGRGVGCGPDQPDDTRRDRGLRAARGRSRYTPRPDVAARRARPDQNAKTRLTRPNKQENDMARFNDFVPHGVIPAILLPFHDDLSIDERSFRSHLQDIAAVEGLSALTINAHSTEVASCTADEQTRVLEITADEVGDRLPIVHGIWADGSLEAARIAKRAQAGGSSALLVFPPAPFTLGQNADMAVVPLKKISSARDLPVIVFQYSLPARQGYPPPTPARPFNK